MATTEQLMEQYGVAWFGFDEVSGNVYDKLGSNYIGTVSGATRVEGWNGEGYAMSFNGSNQYIQFSSRAIPTGEKSIRCKIKASNSPNSSWQYVITESNGANLGTLIALNPSGQLCFINYKANNGVTRFYLVSSISIVDNKWHDILVTWNGTTDEKGVKMYIDNMLQPNNIALSDSLETTTSGRNLTIGYSGTTAYFNGQLDDLQVFNKALIPSDFTQKCLAIKSESNKNLVLSSIVTRVKEIPNTEESTLLNQGGVIHEIDSAIDRPPLDLTGISTEYEIVSTNKSSLNNGKMFTIPIDNNFKTALVEDNY